jgi:hypothetical protein
MFSLLVCKSIFGHNVCRSGSVHPADEKVFSAMDAINVPNVIHHRVIMCSNANSRFLTCTWCLRLYCVSVFSRKAWCGAETSNSRYKLCSAYSDCIIAMRHMIFNSKRAQEPITQMELCCTHATFLSKFLQQGL